MRLKTPAIAWARAPGAALLAVGIALIILANVRPSWWGFREDQVERVGLAIAGLGWLVYVVARRATLRQLNIDESELHLLATQMPANVWTTDLDLRLTSVFGTLIQRLENPAARVPGRTLYDIFETRDENHPAIAAHLRALRGDSASYERVAGDLVVEGRVEPLRDGRGRIIGCVGVVIDVSTWRWAESQVRRFGALVRSSEDAIISTDLDGTIESWNPAAERLYGFTATEAIGKPIAILSPPGGDSEFVGNTLALRQGVAVGPYEARRLRRDGREIYVSVTISPIKDGSGRVVGMSGIVRDITDRKRAEDALRRSQAELRGLAQHLESAREEEHTRMAREIHDELAQSLTALRLDLSWLAKRVPGADQAARAKIAEMAALTDATIEAGRRIAAELRPPILDDLGLIAALEWYVQDFAKRTKLRAVLDPGPQEPALDGRLAVTAYRIVQEALTNVARHAEAKRVTVRLCELDGALVLEITDDGRGMRADAAVSAQSFGIVGMRERVVAHGGALEVANSAAGGTIVRATIPLERRREPLEQG